MVDDGEHGEVTLLAVRAKMYEMDMVINGWKEKGAGMLKVNVPTSTVEFDEDGHPRPETFDASVLGEDEPENGSNSKKSVRLIMRQDSTLRVILNTVILPAMEFKLNTKLKASLVLFMAFEGKEIKQVQMKVCRAAAEGCWTPCADKMMQMSEANAILFTNMMKNIQKELRDV